MQLNNIERSVSIGVLTDAAPRHSESKNYLEPDLNLRFTGAECAQHMSSSSHDSYFQRISEERSTQSGNSEESRATPSLVVCAPKPGVFQSESQRIQDALFTIPADLYRDEWVKVGMALKSYYGDSGFGLFDTWSRQSDKYNERDAKDTYKSLKEDKEVKIGTLFYMAKQHGYGVHKNTVRPCAAHQSLTTPSRSMEAADSPPVNCDIDPSVAGERMDELLRRLPDATPDTPYLKKKGLDPAPGMKQTSEGTLVVPVYDADGNLCSLQFIEGDGRKRFRKGGRPRAVSSCSESRVTMCCFAKGWQQV